MIRVAVLLLLLTYSHTSAAIGEKRDSGCSPLYFEHDTYLGHTVACEQILEQQALPGEPASNAHPAYLKLQFSGYPFPNSSGPGPTIYVFPVYKSYRHLYPGRQDDPWLEQINALRAIVRDHPAWTSPSWQAGQPLTNPPLLPLIDANNVYLAQQKYISFRNGSGVRYLAQLSQNAGRPPSQRDTFYIFQGVTSEVEGIPYGEPSYEPSNYDRRLYITAIFPAFLANPPDGTSNAGFEEQAKLITNALGQTDSAAFNPDISILDSLVASIHITYPLPHADGPGMPDSGAATIFDPYVVLLLVALATIAAGLALRLRIGASKKELLKAPLQIPK